MANLRDVRLRMRAIRQTLQVTKAMNLISTAKLRKGRRILQDTEPFFIRIQKAMFDILTGTEMDKSRFINAGEAGNLSRNAVLVITSDKGLAGGYNANIFRQVTQLCSKLNNPVLILVGEIGHKYFLHSPLLILENYSFKSRMPDLEDAKQVADYLISQYIWGMFDEIHIVYTHMYSSIKLLPREMQLLPLDEKKMQEEFKKTGEARKKRNFEYLPSTRKVFDALVPMYIKGVIYGALVEAYVSEQSARMSAMDEASKSAQDMLSDLQIRYNRARQAGITQEITEIVGGAEAIGN
jgi:F-type H+-transporting ATPase subunit gamma